MTGHTIASPNGDAHDRSDENRRAVRPADGRTGAADDPGGRGGVAGEVELHLDYETFSACELKTEGLDNYARHPTTGVHCAAFAFGNDSVDVIAFRPGGTYQMPLGGKLLHDAVMRHVHSGGTVVAHNAAFEWAIWNHVCVPKYGWPPLRIEQMRCTMAAAYSMALPGALEKVAPALGVEQRKDLVGQRVMMQLAKPKADGTFWKPEDDPAKFQQLYDYCKTDVVVERAIDQRMMRLSPAEQRLWVLDQKINQLGIQVDLPSIDAAIALVEKEKARLNADMLKATGGVVGSCTEVQLLVKWIRTQGTELKGLAKADVLDALKLEDVPPPVRRALLLRQEAAKSSTAKLVAMKQRASSDGRVRGTLQYHGASTGRWAGRGIQVQNFPRGTLKPHEVEDTLALMKADANNGRLIDMMYGPPLDVIASCMRGMIVPAAGRDLVAVDFSAIEARVLAWLAGEEKVLGIFRTHGLIYEHAASGIYGVAIDAVDKTQRQIGKVAVLALGYGGGVGAFQSMARVYGVKVADADAEAIKVAWRASHRKITAYWYDLEGAAMNAVIYPGTPCKSGPAGRQVTFKKNGSFLWCKLPSGRVLCYPYPTIKPVQTPWGEMKDALHFWTVNGTTNKWEETSTYGGSLAENVTQAVARDLLAEALVRLDDAGFATVMHVHDEAVVEIASSAPDDTLARIEALMTAAPAWAAGLPIAAEGWRGKRYRK